MIVNRKKLEIYYPESDGKPMAETDLHRQWMVRVIDILTNFYQNKTVYVTGNILVYFEEGNPKKSVSPDSMVVLHCQPSPRRTFKTWEEPTPSVAFEVTSQKTKRHDLNVKPEVFAKIGIAEYFMYDPTQDYLRPPLLGFRLENGSYIPIQANDDGSLTSYQLNMSVLLENGELTLIDRSNGKKLLTAAEQQWAEREVERAAKEHEREEKEQALEALQKERSRLNDAQAEIERLKELLAKRDTAG